MDPNANLINPNYPVVYTDETGRRFLPETAVFLFDKTLTALQALTDLAVFFDPQFTTLLLGIVGTKTGDYTVNFQYPSGRWMSSSKIRDENIVGSAQFPVMITPVKIPANGKIGIEIADLSNAENAVQIAFLCQRLLPLS